jgi:glycosyltransferase involved in cell wall biosynthesis
MTSSAIDLKPLVSIIINNYNYGCFIRKAIESAITQTYQNIEVIIVDDGSTDESRDIIGEYRSRCILILKENGGQASAFNVGIAAAKGEYILLLDSDDYIYPDAIDVCVKLFPKGYSRIFFNLDLIDGENKPINGKRGENVFQNFDGNVFKALAENDIFAVVPTSGNFFEASKLKKVLPIPENEYKICADIFLFIRTAHNGPVRSVDRRLGAYRIHGSNNFCPKSSSFSKNRIKNQVENIYKNKELIEEGCKKEGYGYSFKIIEKNFVVLNTLFAAYVMKIDTPKNYPLSISDLLRLSIRFLFFGDGYITKRGPQFLYFLALIFLPKVYAILLIRLMHFNMNR